MVTRTDTKEEIRKCLSCHLPECIDCIGHPEVGVVARRHERWKALIKEYHALGMTDRQMAGMLSVSPNTVGALRKELGLPLNIGGIKRGRPSRKEIQGILREHDL